MGRTSTRTFAVTMVAWAVATGCGAGKSGGPRGTGGAGTGLGGLAGGAAGAGASTGGLATGATSAGGAGGGVDSGGFEADAHGSGGSLDGGPGGDRADAREAAADEPDGWVDAPAYLCPTAASRGRAVPSSACSISHFAFDIAVVCGGAKPCPITTAYSLRCSDSNSYGPWLVPNGAEGASVLFSSGNITPHLFTIGADSRVDDLPAPDLAVTSLALERDGTRTIFAGEQPGLSRMREGATGWQVDEATSVADGDLAMVGEGRAIDETRAFVAYANLVDELPRLAVRDGSCWRTTLLGTTQVVSVAMDLDASNRPWVAWLGNSAGKPLLGLVGPDGSSYTPSAWSGDGSHSFWDRPIVLAGGLGGLDAFPALAVQLNDGIHVLTPGTATPSWADLVMPGSGALVTTGDCPTTLYGPTGSDCSNLTSCTGRMQGTLSGFGLARTTGGRAYAGWLEVDETIVYALKPSGSTCGFPGSPCGCQSTVTSSTRTLTLAVARVGQAGTADQAIRRFPIASGSADGTLPRAFSLVMAARGDTLLAIAKLSVAPDSRLLYLEMDSSRLP